MASDEQRIGGLAEAVLDGDSVDWAAAELEGGTMGRLARHLKIVASVADAHREAAALQPSSTRESTPRLETWGHLRIRELIGRGAFGDVYRACDPKLDREVALKLIPADGDDAAAAIIREGRLLARVRHPNVVTIHGADQIDGYVGLWMELVPGRTLEEILQAGPKFEPAEVTRIGIELSRALSAVHAAGLLHRDVKAQNVMRSDDGRIVLMDFGTGRELADVGSDVSGTPLYLAPEVLQGQPATEQSDIYSLGILLYHLLTRSYPVNGKTIRELRLGHEHRKSVQGRPHPDIPPRLAHAISRAIDPQSERRYATATALHADLSRTLKASALLRWLRYGASAAALAILAWVARDSVRERPNIGHTQRLTAQEQVEIDPAISPDGTLVAYAAGTPSVMRVFISSVAGGSALPLSNDGRDISQNRPRWSPDGLHLVYVTREGAFVVPATGGEAIRIDSPSDPDGGRTQATNSMNGVRVTGATWSPDGQRIAIAYGGTLTILTLDTGERRHLSLGLPHELHECDWSLDDKWIACTSGNWQFAGRLRSGRVGTFGNVAPSAIVLVPTKGGPPVELTPRTAQHRSPVWRGDRLYFVSNHQGTSDIYSVAISSDGRAQGEPGRFTFGLEARSISFSRDGRTLAYSTYSARSNIWSLPIPTHSATNTSSAKQVTSGRQIIESIAVSPDERWLLFDSTLFGNADIFRTPIGGGMTEPLTADPADDFAPQLSPSGLLVAFHSFRTGTREVYVQPIGGPADRVTYTSAAATFPSVDG